MAKQKKTTTSTKRYRYSSFKEKIDDLRIDPAKKLDKRVHDFVESSHFLASFEHWKEFNLSATFCAFASEVEGIIQTLPQLLYHDEKIFNILIAHIEKHDKNSLQALLDLLSQFCHDLGPDFLKFYSRALQTLITLLDNAVSIENPDVFEWGFSSLAYMFKYLSRSLAQNLVPTFELLFPLLSHKKDYMSRFSAEALSFLIRKANIKSLGTIIKYAFKLISENEQNSYYEGLQTLFSESLISSSEALHSRSETIFTVLLSESLNSEHTSTCLSLVCDVVMDTLRHASVESAAPFYNYTLVAVKGYLENEDEMIDLTRLAKLLLVLSYAESGKKVPDWAKLLECVKLLIKLSNRQNIESEPLAFLFATVLRNAEFKVLTTHHKMIFDYFMQEFPSRCIDFFRLAMEFAMENFLAFGGITFLQKFINANCELNAKKIALLFLELSEKQLDCAKTLLIPNDFRDRILDELVSLTKVEACDSFELYYRTVLLMRADCKGVRNHPIIAHLLNCPFDNYLMGDVIGNLLLIIPSTGSVLSPDVIKSLVNNFEKIPHNLQLIKGLNHISVENGLDVALLEQELLPALTNNLLLPSRELRYETLKFIRTIMGKMESEVPQLLNDMLIIEEIPMTLQNGRDITMRIRNLGTTFLQNDTQSTLRTVFMKYVLGLMTARFSPIWDGVNAVIPTVYKKDQDLVWTILLNYISRKQLSNLINFPQIPCASSLEEQFWSVHVDRLNAALDNAGAMFKRYHDVDSSMLELIKKRFDDNEHPKLLRSQSLKMLILLSDLAEKNSKDIVPFLLKQDEISLDEAVESGSEPLSTSKGWYEGDRNLLLKIFGNFKNIKAIYKSDEVYQRLMELLTSRTTETQLLALNAIFAYKEPMLMKYKDNLKNLLDNALFKDEVTKLLVNNEAREISNQDLELILPVILRILFGRAQTANTSGINKSRKFSVINILPNLKDEHIVKFLALGSGRFNFEYFYENGNQLEPEEINSGNMTRMVGFINLASSVVNVLGCKIRAAVPTIINPLIYCIQASYFVSSNSISDDKIDKIAINIRHQGMKCLYEIFEYVQDSFLWSSFVKSIHDNVIHPRLLKFKDENLQQPSYIMKLISYWSKHSSLYEFLYYDNCAVIKAFCETLINENARPAVLNTILETFTQLVASPIAGDEYCDAVSLIITTSLVALPKLLRSSDDFSVLSNALTLLMKISEQEYVHDDEIKRLLLESLTLVLEKELKNLKTTERVKIFSCISSLLSKFNCEWTTIENLYKICSKSYKDVKEKQVRESLNEVFSSIALNFEELRPVADLLFDLNSYSATRIQEYDFVRILPAFKVFTEVKYMEFTELQWYPILNTLLYFINDKDELALRTNATFALCKFIEYTNSKSTLNEASGCMEIIKTDLLPAIKSGLRSSSEEVQSEYISLLSFIVSNPGHFNEFDDMKCLLIGGDEEANFFKNINHIQMHRRQRAIKRLAECGEQLSANSVAHYLVPMIERYIFKDDEKFRNIFNETVNAIGILSKYFNWNQFKAFLKRYISMLKTKPSHMKEIISVIVQVSKTFKCSLYHQNDENYGCIRGFPSQINEPRSFVQDIYPILHKVLSTRDDETAVIRIPLAQALVDFVLGLGDDDITLYLPAILTSICQILRSRSEELREAVRKSLGSITVSLGSDYFKFLLQELKSALTRGSQIHVLSYTVHYVLMVMSESSNLGNLDESSKLIINVIMEDIFGTTGQDKDAEGYTSKMKEVKFNKSYDTAEILLSHISLASFENVLRPIKALLLERLTLKTQNKLEELLRRLTLGLSRNPSYASTEILTLCYSIYQDSKAIPADSRQNPNIQDEKAEFFLVKLNAKSKTVQVENSYYASFLQKFSLDLLRTVLSKHSNLVEVEYLQGFIPMLSETLLSENEAVVISTLKLLIVIIKLDFPEESVAIFKNCARKTLNIIKDSPSTSTEICQVSLKFLSALIRYNDIKLKDTALDYIIGRIQPDLMEPNKQGLAFGFLKVVIAKHIMLPKLYDVIDVVAEIMVVNHAKEIRDVARSVYYQFLMEYDQSKGRLEKQFKFLVTNLQYKSQDGRKSVMELLNLIINKSQLELLKKISSSFFVCLANVAVSDDSPSCRKMATILLSNLFKRLGSANITTIEKYISTWLKQTQDPVFVILGLKIYKILLSELGPETNESLTELAMLRIRSIVSDIDIGSDSIWDDVYTALETFAVYLKTKNGTPPSDEIWNNIIGCILYPHEWVRLSATRLLYSLMSETSSIEYFDLATIQTIAYRLFRLLSAPSNTNSSSKLFAVKILVLIIQNWQKNDTPYRPHTDTDEKKYTSAIEFAIARAGAIIRSEENQSESHSSKVATIQLLAMIIQILDVDQLTLHAENLILPLFTYMETLPKNASEELIELATNAGECIQLLEDKIPVSDFTKSYSAVKQFVLGRRQDRKAKKAILATTAPDIAAARKLKKHSRSREKRKHERDENGYYHRKSKKKRV